MNYRSLSHIFFQNSEKNVILTYFIICNLLGNKKSKAISLATKNQLFLKKIGQIKYIYIYIYICIYIYIYI